MDISLNASVSCTNESDVGHAETIILNPITREVTHFVVKTKGFAGVEILVPMENIKSSSHEEIQLNCTWEELEQMKPFVHTEYIGPDEMEESTFITAYPYGMEDVMLTPFVAPAEAAYLPVEEIPLNELAIHRGSIVEASDGMVGRVDEFIINPENHHISHLVLRKGHFLGQKEITVPISAIDHIATDTVYLNLDMVAVKELPTVRVHRLGRK